ncbi:MAG TPA: cytochrome C [Campylobacterales bacterium]|nr:cytochrome C [Campylobacterales bacterium]HHS93589.1 cytochrome C [Campylobacterales bacterium]
MSNIFKILTAGTLMLSMASGASTAVCKGCHGQNFEKSAMGKAKVVKNMTKAEIVKALTGYKSGTYGGAMKGLMKAQVKNLSESDIKNIADAIGK